MPNDDDLSTAPKDNPADSKLTDAKEAWAKEGRMPPRQATSGPRLPPGQREVKNWPVLDLGVQPEIAPADWSLAVDGLVANPFVWRWDDFIAQPQADLVSDIHCVTAWSRFDNAWRGVTARHLLALARPLPEARFILCYGHDGYTTNVPLSIFDDSDVILACQWQGQPMTAEHGGPVRLVIPKLYFWKSAKWINRIAFLADDKPGFWEERGYHNDGDPWQEQRYS
jgi:DMSO/TMAO reductase YedYZ molybdopterin-dependent catalytic subunit